jgi:hypothetical protein
LFFVFMSRSFPLRWRAKPAVLLVALILAGCGGAGKSKPQAQTVHGSGFQFAAPAGWSVTRTKRAVAAESGDIDRVEVRTFRLVKPYRPQLFAAAARELDAVVTKIAEQLSGRVTSTQTIRVAGRRARAYRIVYDGKVQELTFVLVGPVEHQLLCRRAANSTDEACRQLVRSFVLS